MNRKQRRMESRQGRMTGAPSVPAVLAEAVRHHQAGRLNEAEQRYRWILRADPRHADALHLLGTLARDAGHHAAAIELIGQAIAQAGDRPAFHDSLGTALLALGRLDEAASAYRRALGLMPKAAPFHYNLGLVLRRQGKPDAAEDCFRQALILDAEDADSRMELAGVLMDRGRPGEAEACYRQVLVRRPNDPTALYNLGIALREQGDLDEAATCYRRVLALLPDYAAAHYNLGNILLAQGALDEAEACYQATLMLAPDNASAHNNLGIVLQERGRLDAAAGCFSRALARAPDFVPAYENLAGIRQEQGRLDAALACYDQALARGLDGPKLAMGRVFTQLYRPGVGLADILTQSREVATRYAAPFREHGSTFPRPASPDRRPRIGFVSADFRAHAVGSLALPAIEALGRAGYHLTCYSNSTRDDTITARFVAVSNVWRRVAALSDDALAEQIRADAIDILVDLSGYTAGHRLFVFARKPAPIQVTWIGYPATTGFAAIDYILADRHQVPPGSEAFYTEAVVRLSGSYIAFAPPEEAPPLGEPPCLAGSGVTFGSFNALKKITPEVVAVWSRMLARLPASRLLLKAPALDCTVTRGDYTARFAAHGVAEARLSLIGRTTRADHLAQMLETDIALDSFPYSGGQTTLEALWMGLPVVTLPGETFASRHTLGYLSTIGLGELAASSVDDYIDRAVALAEDTTRLRDLRAGLRARIQASPLCDTDRFVEGLSAAFETMWRRFCAGEPSNAFDVA